MSFKKGSKKCSGCFCPKYSCNSNFPFSSYFFYNLVSHLCSCTCSQYIA